MLKVTKTCDYFTSKSLSIHPSTNYTTYLLRVAGGPRANLSPHGARAEVHPGHVDSLSQD